MEYGIWSLHVAGELWGDPRLARRHPILPSGATQILPRAAFALSALHRPDMLPLPLTAAGPPYVPIELVTKPASVANAEDAEDGEKSTNDEDEDPQQRDDNEDNIENTDQNENQVRHLIIMQHNIKPITLQYLKLMIFELILYRVQKVLI